MGMKHLWYVFLSLGKFSICRPLRVLYKMGRKELSRSRSFIANVFEVVKFVIRLGYRKCFGEMEIKVPANILVNITLILVY